ncbi:GrpB domain, predicted nucleotidyltransferase, UPF0157 family [Chitinophaga jiangningensis]|uniref:GrpB domain, predicted nucleotidyltransferase, UPF0157 family n=1 Tax=Chitinophaga jiangningensis TaxID=1419482 RepID=A0A1M7CZF2_9BACT|nr:GrpB family protein [Chitinophaga jiangningensis]SHL72507.1 GrpB domain, predicted nucleotidyltransferase, UPF0157 family [Chitinophaga jiangningensis]
MKLPFEPYNHEWKLTYSNLEKELLQILGSLKPVVAHIGSTSIEGLSAKPVIDILVGLRDESQLDQVPALLMAKNYIYYPKYNEEMPYRRFFIKLKIPPQRLSLPLQFGKGDEMPDIMHDHHYRLAHIHIIPVTSSHWTRHIAFRDYVRSHPAVRAEYQQLKTDLVKQEWKDGNDYNDAKDAFMKRTEKAAVEWYTQSH